MRREAGRSGAPHKGNGGTPVQQGVTWVSFELENGWKHLEIIR